VAVLAYTMPIWAALFAYPILGERLNVICAISPLALRRRIDGADLSVARIERT